MDDEMACSSDSHPATTLPITSSVDVEQQIVSSQIADPMQEAKEKEEQKDINKSPACHRVLMQQKEVSETFPSSEASDSYASPIEQHVERTGMSSKNESCSDVANKSELNETKLTVSSSDAVSEDVDEDDDNDGCNNVINPLPSVTCPSNCSDNNVTTTKLQSIDVDGDTTQTVISSSETVKCMTKLTMESSDAISDEAVPTTQCVLNNDANLTDGLGVKLESQLIDDYSNSNTSSSEESHNTNANNNKRRASHPTSKSSLKRLKTAIEENCLTRDRILNDYLELSECHTVEQLQTYVEQIASEIRTLSELATEKEKEWNNVIHLKKLKEELLARLQRKKQVMYLYGSSSADLHFDVPFDVVQMDGNNHPADNQEKQLSSASDNNRHHHHRLGRLSNHKQKNLTGAKAPHMMYSPELNGDYKSISRNRPVLDVQSIIADYRQRHPESVPRRGRRIRHAQGSSSDSNGVATETSSSHTVEPSFRDMLVHFAKMSQTERNELFQTVAKSSQQYPEVTVHPVTSNANGTNSQHSLLHGILTKNASKQNTKTSFSPTLARLLTAPERNNGNVAPIQTTATCNNMSISEILTNSKTRNEITITPVSVQFEHTLKGKSTATTRMDDDEIEDCTDRLVIDEGIEANDIKGRSDNSSDVGDDVPQCQGCNQKSALFVCAGCGNQWYCSRDCQVAAWDEHSEVCSG